MIWGVIAMHFFSTRTRRRAAALTGGATLALSGLATVPLMASDANAAAPTITGTTLYSGSTSTTSTTGHKLSLNLSAGDYGSGSKSIGVSLGTPNNVESHSWSFSAPDSAFVIDSQGKGKIAMTAAKLGGYGVMNLHVKPVAPVKTTSCQGQVMNKTRKVSIVGTFRFITKSTGGHKWGSVGHTRTFHFAPSYVTWYYQNTATCPSTPLPCRSGLSWSSSKYSTKSSTSIYGGSSGSKSYLYGSRSVTLSKPAHASRYDAVNLTSKAAKLTVAPNGSAKLKQVLGRGSAVLAGPSGSTSTNPCGTGSKSERATSWSGSYTNGRTPLKLPAQVFGPILLKSSPTGGYFSRTKIIG